MFRKNNIPEPVIAFAREQCSQIVVYRPSVEITPEKMKREFYQNCENVNQVIVRKIPNALPMERKTVEHDKDHNIILMRVMQYRDKEYYVNAVQVFIRVASVMGCKRWAQISKASPKMFKRISGNFTYAFTSDSEQIVVSSKDMRVKEFCYKL